MSVFVGGGNILLSAILLYINIKKSNSPEIVASWQGIEAKHEVRFGLPISECMLRYKKSQNIPESNIW